MFAIASLLGFIVLQVYDARICASGTPSYYPPSYCNIVSQARSEGHLVVYGVVDSETGAMSALLQAFHRRYPFIQVTVADSDGTRTYQQVREGVTAGKPAIDFVWSRAMHLQEKLINDGYSQPYATPEMRYLPRSAHWRDLGYSATLEPLVFVYNRRFFPKKEMPQTHTGLNALLAADTNRFQGKVAVYNPETSEVGMLLLSEDVRITRDTWKLYDTFGAINVHAVRTSREMLRGLVKGDQWIAYNIVASYAVEAKRRHPELEIVYPTDYILDLSRIGFIAVNAPHPNAAKLFLDFVLSKAGQTILKDQGMGPVRTDMQPAMDPSKPYLVRTQIIRIGPGLLATLDKLVRAELLRRWQHAWSQTD